MPHQIVALVVDDEPILRMAVVEHLTLEGLRVFEAANADQAIVILEAVSSIDVIFTDIEMPGSMDGLKLAAAVRRRWPPVRIIVTSGRHFDQPAGMPDGSIFIGKPYDFGAVTAKMREMAA